MRLIIDGYNLLFAIGPLPGILKEMANARQRLIDRLIGYNRRRRHQIALIFDGEGKAAHYRDQDIKIIFTRRDKDADTFIIEFVLNDPHPADILVVSSDRAIRNALRSTRARLIRVKEFFREIGIRGGTTRGRSMAQGKTGFRNDEKNNDLPEPSEKTSGIPKSEVKDWLEIFGLEEE